MFYMSILWHDTIWNTNISKIKKISAMYKDILCIEGPFCDAVIEVEDAKFSIHRIILSQCSAFLRCLFENYPNQKTFKFSNISPEIIHLIIQFAYTGSVPVTLHNVQNLMLVADWLNVKGIIHICSNFLDKGLCPNNCINILQFTNICFGSDLRSKALHYISDHFEEVILCEEFLQLSVEELVKILGRDDLNVRTERTAFDAILRWITSRPNEREQHIPVLLSKVRLALTNRNYITRNVLSNNLVKNNSQCMEIVKHNLTTLWYMASCVAWRNIYINPFGRPRLPNAILLAIGGCLQRKSTSKVYTYDVSANRWWTFPKHLDCSRAFHGTVFLGGYVYCIGGFNSDVQRQGKFLNTVSRLDLLTHLWKDVANMHYRRSNVAVAVLNGLIYALGGHDGFHPLRSAECYNPKSNQWKRIENMNQNRSDAACTALNSKIYICGGFTGHEVLPTAEFYNPTTNQWTDIVPMNKSRTELAVTVYQNRIYAAGGIEINVRLRTAEVYDPETNTWTPIPNMITPRSSFCLEVIDDRIFAIGGKNTLSYYQYSNFEYYDAKENVWCQGISTFPSLCGMGCCVIYGIPNLADFTFSRESLLNVEFNSADEEIALTSLQL